MRILSICSGVSQLLVLSQNPLRTTQSAIRKTIVSALERPEPIGLTPLGLASDEQSDLSVHGGLDKALYVYPVEHWGDWQTRIGLHTHAGLFGENLCVEGFTEDTVYLGDQWRIGQALLQVTEPRIPCDKFCAVLKHPQAAKVMVQTGLCGWYLRILQPAPLAAGMPIEVTAGAREQSIAQAFAMQTRRHR